MSEEDKKEEEEEEEVPLQKEAKEKAGSSSATPKKQRNPKKKKQMSLQKDIQFQTQKKTKKKIVVVGKEYWFSGLKMLKGRVMDPATSEIFGMKEFLEKLKHKI